MLAVLVLLALPAVAGAQGLPESPGREVVSSRCLTCHQADLIVQQRLSAAGWGRSVDKMVRWGATVLPAEREPLVAYLARRYGTTAAAAPSASHESGRSAFKQACLSCHGTDLVEQQRLTRAGWARSVDKMVRWGANVPAERKDALVDYLASQHGVK